VFHTHRDGVSGLGLFTCWVVSVLEALPQVVTQAATVKTTSNELCKTITISDECTIIFIRGEAALYTSSQLDLDGHQ
jgi:hypothetical protein